MNFAAHALLAVAIPPFGSWIWSVIWRLLRQEPTFVGVWIGSGAGGILIGIVSKDMAWLTGSAVSLVIGVAIWWWRRKDRKRAAKLAGAKSRARLAAIVRRAREVAQPRPVLKPQRQGAGA